MIVIIIVRLANTKFCFYFSALKHKLHCVNHKIICLNSSTSVFQGVCCYIGVTVQFKNADTHFAGTGSLMPAKVRRPHGHLVPNSSPSHGVQSARVPLGGCMWGMTASESEPCCSLAGQQGACTRAPFIVSGENEALPSCLCMALSSITELSLFHCIWGLQKFIRLEILK